jgi:WD40 repeat protein
MPHRGRLHCLAFSPDGKTLMTGGSVAKTAEQPESGEARFWDSHTGLPIGPVLVHAAPIGAVAFSPDGQTVVTGSSDTMNPRICIWYRSPVRYSHSVINFATNAVLGFEVHLRSESSWKFLKSSVHKRHARKLRGLHCYFCPCILWRGLYNDLNAPDNVLKFTFLLVVGLQVTRRQKYDSDSV